jgi:phosphoglycerate dehydrogenase-like enzyme
MIEPSVRVVLHPVHGPGLGEALSEVSGVQVLQPEDGDGVVAALEDGVDVLVTFAWEDRFLTGSLRWIQAISAGVDQFPLDAVDDAGIVLCSAGDAHTPAVAEHAIALLMAAVRGIGPAMRDVPGRLWQIRRAYEVRDRTLGVLGLGSIGEEVARLAKGLGMRVIGTKRSPTDYSGEAERVFGPEGTIEVCREADAIVAALPSAEAPAVGAAELDALGEGWIVNVGRGTAIDENALIDALTDGRLRGAALDVFATEPLPADSPLWDVPNVIITPHAAWSTDRLSPRVAAVFAVNLTAYRGEGPWTSRVV